MFDDDDDEDDDNDEYEDMYPLFGGFFVPEEDFEEYLTEHCDTCVNCRQTPDKDEWRLLDWLSEFQYVCHSCQTMIGPEDYQLLDQMRGSCYG